MTSKLELRPLTLKQANELVSRWHRHHKPVVGHRFSIGLFDVGIHPEGELVGAAIIGRPVARKLDDGFTAEVNRLVTDGTYNACSMLYGASWRAWKAMGGRRIFTYTLLSEDGASLRGAGWEHIRNVKPSSSAWNVPSRPRKRYEHDNEEKKVWLKQL